MHKICLDFRKPLGVVCPMTSSAFCGMSLMIEIPGVPVTTADQIVLYTMLFEMYKSISIRVPA